jgi:putative addiction module CopG family antidote
MTSHNINISDQQTEFIRRLIDEGRFGSIHEVFRAIVLLLEERVAREADKRSELRGMLEEAISEGVSPRTPQEIWDAAEAR